MKYLRKPSPLFQLPHELLSGGAAIFIPPDCILLSFSNKNFKKKGRGKILQDRHGVFAQARAGQNEELPAGTCAKVARTDFAGNSQLLPLLLRLPVFCRLLHKREDQAAKLILSVSCEVCNLGQFGFGTTCGISIFRHAAFIMFVDRGHR